MTTTHGIETPTGKIAVHESGGGGPPIVFVHGNSSSARTFSRQFEGPLAQHFRLIAIDLPGHGASDDATDGAYSLKGHARAIRQAVEALGVGDAVFVGWSLGGHIVLELAPSLPQARGFAIFGTPPLAFPAAMDAAFLPNPAMGIGFAEQVDRAQAEAYVASFFAPGFRDIPGFFAEDILRTDGRARSGAYASLGPGGYLDEAVVVRELHAPLAVLHGAEEQLINRDYFDTLAMPTLWRGAVQVIPGAGHAPHWETPEAFDALIEAFAQA